MMLTDFDLTRPDLYTPDDNSLTSLNPQYTATARALWATSRGPNVFKVPVPPATRTQESMSVVPVVIEPGEGIRVSILPRTFASSTILGDTNGHLELTGTAALPNNAVPILRAIIDNAPREGAPSTANYRLETLAETVLALPSWDGRTLSLEEPQSSSTEPRERRLTMSGHTITAWRPTDTGYDTATLWVPCTWDHQSLAPVVSAMLEPGWTEAGPKKRARYAPLLAALDAPGILAELLRDDDGFTSIHLTLADGSAIVIEDEDRHDLPKKPSDVGFWHAEHHHRGDPLVDYAPRDIVRIASTQRVAEQRLVEGVHAYVQALYEVQYRRPPLTRR